MQNQYWMEFGIYLSAIALSVILGVLVMILFAKRKLSLKYCIGAALALTFLMFVSIYRFTFCAKDYELVKNDTFMEETLEMIEFTEVKRDWDGNGQISYLSPKFYNREKDEYIILYTKEVEVGKTYRIRYYPNTRICEILYCVDDVFP